MLYPPVTFTCLASAIVIFVASSTTLVQIHKGSKSQFAYVLMVFSFADGV